MKRASGVLMHVSSLFGDYSIGSFGRAAQHFIDFLADSGFSYWQVDTDDCEISFTVQDTFRNLLRIGEDRVAVFDVDGNRFEIESLSSLDRKSYKKIELYL